MERSKVRILLSLASGVVALRSRANCAVAVGLQHSLPVALSADGCTKRPMFLSFRS
jgi:hypothetical protein